MGTPARRFILIGLFLTYGAIPIYPSNNPTFTTGTHVFAKGGLRLRAEPNETSKVLEIIPNHVRLPIVDEEKYFPQYEAPFNWIPAKFNKKTGYVARDFLRNVLSVRSSPDKHKTLIEVAPFAVHRGEYLAESTFYLLEAGNLRLLGGPFKETSEPFWIDNNYVIFKSHFADGGAGFDDTIRIDTARGKFDVIYGISHNFEDSEGCKVSNDCFCANKIFNSFGNEYAIEILGSEAKIYRFPKNYSEMPGRCYHGITRANMKLIGDMKTNGMELYIDETYYCGLKLRVGKKSYVVDPDADKLIEK